MLRIGILFIILILAILEYRKPMPPIVFRLTFLGMTLFLALRCGQGTDYFSYSYIYTEGIVEDVEVGYAFLNRIFSELHLPYTVFVFVFAVLTMAVLYVILQKFALNQFMALFVVYAVYYLQYFENGIRQAIAMLLVMAGFCLTIQKNRIWYLLGSILLAITLHTSAIVGAALLLPYLLDKSKAVQAFVQRRRGILLALFAVVCVGFLGLSYSGGLLKIAAWLPNVLAVKVIGYLHECSYSVMALLSRVAFLAVIATLYYCAGKNVTRFERLLVQAYLLGFFLYCVLFGADLIASRINAYFKLLEVILIPNLIFHFDEDKIGLRALPRVGLVSATCLLMVFMYCKTTKDVMAQSRYYQPSYWNYPYFSVFSDLQKLDELRQAPTFMHVDYYAFVEKANPRQVGVGPNASNSVFPGLPIPPLPNVEKNPFDYVFAPDPLSEASATLNFIGGDRDATYRDGSTAVLLPTIRPTSTPPRRIKDYFTARDKMED